MNRSSRLRSLWPVAAFSASSVFIAAPVLAQEATGQLTGRVTDKSTGLPLSGITVVVQGPQGEDGGITDALGVYLFTALPVGTYTVHFYTANSATKVETPPLEISAQKTAKANAEIPSEAATAAEQTYVIQRKASSIDVGSSQFGTSWDAKAIENLPLGNTTFDSLIEKAPGAFVDPSGSVSIGGATGLENQYVLDGVNITGMEYGQLGSRLSSTFVRELQINSAGYAAEYGGAMGGTINVITKSGSNDPHATANLSWAPYWFSKSPHLLGRPTDNVVGIAKPDYDTELAAEGGGAIIKDKLFWWVGVSGRFEKDHVFRVVRAGEMDANGNQTLDSSGNPTFHEVQRDRVNLPKHFLQYGGKVDFVPAPGHRLTLSLMAAPSEQRDLHPLGAGQSPISGDPRWMQAQLSRDSLDTSLRYTGNFLDRHLELDALAGLHNEHYSARSPFSDLNDTNQIWHNNQDIYSLEGNPGCAPVTTAAGGTFNPCGGPLGSYYSGGYGEIKEWTGNRWQFGLKAAWRELWGPVHSELKGGAQVDYSTFDQTRHYSGPSDDQHNLLIYDPINDYAQKWSFFSLPKDKYPFQFKDHEAELAGPDYYRSKLVANVSGLNTGLFLQESASILQYVTLNVGGRLDLQQLSDYQGNSFLSLANFAPRVGMVVDPRGDGRTKVSAHYGQFYESIPMNLAARYFGGEGILLQNYDPGSCTKPPSQWKGTGNETAGCASLGAGFQNNGKDYPVQPNIRGQFNHEIAIGFEHELLENLVVGVDYTRRWLGRIIEDGTAAGDFTFVLVNPGQINQSVIDQADREAKAKQAEADAASATDKGHLQDQADDLKAKLGQLKALQQAPKPERTYNALTFRADKRFSRYFAVRGSYTYSRLIGNYNGLFDADNNYFAPNGGNAYDTPDLWANKRGPLANDRPHSGRLDGYTTLPLSDHDDLTFGLGFFARSGAPRNYQASAYPGLNDVFLLPRGSAGRTPAVWQFDAKIAYRHKVQGLQLEAFIDLINLFNQQAALQMDDNYTYDIAAAIVNGTKDDLKYAKNGSGQPITKNSNFGNPLAYQAPFHGRLGLRVVY